IGTGGALTRLPNRIQIIQTALEEEKRMELLPDSNIDIFVDEDNIIASLGVMSLEYPEAAAKLARKSLRLAQRRDKE
ncbi:MAG: DNA mismatch repair protein MutL, partial [Clostridium sp.]|nr:DNA mismatch repair protein MutL [Clostridium sp.]